jgi:hypothetical protein
MGRFMNEPETGGSFCAVPDPSSSSRRLRREARAIAIVKAIPPTPIIGAIPLRVEPVRPDPTYTFWRHPNDTFPLGMVIYFMYSAGRVKIGFSTGLRGRQLQLKASGPFPPVVVLIVKGTEESEREIHAKFAADRLHGEWFKLSPKIRSFLRFRLCPVGRASLERAEAEFRDYCAEFLDGYRPPPKRGPAAKQCSRGKPTHQPCAPCEDERELEILAGLRAKRETAISTGELHNE